MPFVITGGSGFVGLSLLMVLHRAEVSCLVLDLAPPKPALAEHLDFRRTRFLPIDLFSTVDTQRIAAQLPERLALVHMAALVSVGRSIDDAGLREMDVQFAMAENLLDLLGPRITHLCFASSIEVYGPLQALPADETHPAEPDRIYGANKLMLEQVLAAGARCFGFPLAILRIGHVYEPFEHMRSATHEMRARRAIPSFLRAAINGQEIVLNGEGCDLRDYIHAGDFAQAVIRAILLTANATVNIASGVSLRQSGRLLSFRAQPSAQHRSSRSAGERERPYHTSSRSKQRGAFSDTSLYSISTPRLPTRRRGCVGLYV